MILSASLSRNHQYENLSQADRALRAHGFTSNIVPGGISVVTSSLEEAETAISIAEGYGVVLLPGETERMQRERKHWNS